MRISHSHKFIFLANPRTGSTSVRSVLNNYSDIKSVHITETTKSFPFYHHISARELKNIFEKRCWDWDGYRKFCIVRNPYDRVVSLYHHHLSLRRRDKRMIKSLVKKFIALVTPEPSFEEYVMKINPEDRLPTSLESFLCDKEGNFLVKDILMFEKLSSDLPEYLKGLGISITSKDIPHLNFSNSRREYRKYYNEDL